jgi:hypothetical protein
MNTTQLWFALTTNPVTCKIFTGVYSSDGLKNIDLCNEHVCLIICNTHPSHKIGEHWVVFYKNGKDVEFFDSLGKTVSHYGKRFVNFVDKITQMTGNVHSIQSRIQPEGTILCGEYCLYYAYARARGQSMSDIMYNIPSMQTLPFFIRDIFCIFHVDELKNINSLNNQTCIRC